MWSDITRRAITHTLIFMPASLRTSGADSRSLPEVSATVVTSQSSFFKKLFAFAGPAYLVSVGYMDPGNWATDIEGGSRFGYSLLWVLLMSNMMALLLQTLSARMGIVAGRDLAQACRDLYPKIVRIPLWLLCEVAIAACDLAEVIGTIIGLHLLFGIPFEWGLLVTILDTFLLLAIQRLGIRKMEAFIVSLVFMIGACFLVEIILASPEWGSVLRGFIPHISSKAPFVFSDIGALYVAIGILGATVMPHNLYLHSALVQSRSIENSRKGKADACRYNFIDSFIALNAAFFVNAAILILAAAAFGSNGIVVAGIEDAHRLLPQFLGPTFAATLFAIALLCAGQSSTLTGTLAGQIVMEGFLSLRMQPWLRRFLTRSIALIPAAMTVFVFGAEKLQDLLVLSQVILSLQLPFAIIPLIRFTSDKRYMGDFANPHTVKSIAWLIASIIIALNVYLATSTIIEWSKEAGLFVTIVASLIASGVGALLLWLIAEPFFTGYRKDVLQTPRSGEHIVATLQVPKFHSIGVALENVENDRIAVEHAVVLARAHDAEILLIHVVDGVGAQWNGADTSDEERRGDESYMQELVQALISKGIRTRSTLRYGNPAKELIAVSKQENLDLMILRGHGHGFVADRMLGQTIETIRHALTIPVFIVRS